METTVCSNCQSQLSENFCPNCGQKRLDGRLSWREVREEISEKVVGLEKGLLNTLWAMLSRLGKPATDYVNGIRKPYVSPVQYYFLGITLMLFSMEIFGVFKAQGEAFMAESLEGAGAEQAKVTKEATEWIFKYMRVFMTVAIPIQAFAMWKLFKKKGYSYLECFVIALFVEGTVGFAQGILNPLHYLVGTHFLTGSTLLLMIYSFLTVKRIFSSGWLRTLGYLISYYFLTFLILGGGAGIAAIVMVLGKKLLGS